jgi:hypothetical protein
MVTSRTRNVTANHSANRVMAKPTCRLFVVTHLRHLRAIPDGGGAEQLRDAWRARSLAEGWSVPEDWWSPAVEAVAEAAQTGHGMGLACARLGSARGRAGVGIGETLDDLGALFSVLGWIDPPQGLVRCLAEGWVDAGLIDITAASCEDPLTGMATPAYLRTRLTEMYREAAHGGRPVDETHCLVMVELVAEAPAWRRLARAVVVGHDLRSVFAGGETLTLIGIGRAAALVPVRPDLEFRTAGLRRALNGERDALIWTERLPPRYEEAMALLDALAH